MGDDDPGAGEGAVPKLTLSQRILAALPNLQRAPKAPPPNSSVSRGNASSGSARPVARPRTAGATAGPDKVAASKSDAKSAPGSDTGAAPEPDEIVEPDEVVEANGASTTRTAAPRTVTRSGGQTRATARSTSGTNPYEGMSRTELEYGMKYLGDQERRFALLVGPLVGVLDVILTVVTLHNNPPLHVHGHLNKLHANPSTIVALGVGSAVIACLVAVCAWFRRRSLTIFALLFSGYGGGLLTMLPSWAMAGWLFIHFSRMQKALRALGGGVRSGGRVPSKPGEAARAGATSARARSRDRSGERRERGKKQPVPTGPGASKRYTPPRPTRPRPPAPS